MQIDRFPFSLITYTRVHAHTLMRSCETYTTIGFYRFRFDEQENPLLLIW